MIDDKEQGLGDTIKDTSSSILDAGNQIKSGIHTISNEFTKDKVKKIAREGVRQGTAAAGRSAAAGATAGTSEVIYQVLDKLKKGLDLVRQKNSSEINGFTYFIIIIAVMICLIFTSSTAIHQEMLPGQVSTLYDFQKDGTAKSKLGSKSLWELLNPFSLTEEETMEAYDRSLPYKESISQNVNLCKKYVKRAYDYQMEEVLKQYCDEKGYDYELSVSKTQALNSKESITTAYNYTYLISIASQTKENTYKKFNSVDYKTYFKENYKKLLQSGEKSNGKITRKDSLGNPYTVTYCVFEITSIPITTMYSIFNITPDGKHPVVKNATNREILPYNVEILKKYAKQAGIDLGEHSDPTEFANGYGNDSIDTDRLRDLELIYGDLTSLQQKIVSYAMSAVGCKYDQNRRLEEGIYDCSSLCARAYLSIGIQFGSYAYPTSAYIGKYLVDKGCEISTSYAPDLMQPGDLIFWKETYHPADLNTRFRKITHVAIYVGNGQMVSAAGKKSGVVFKEVNQKDKIVSVSRPFYLQ